MIIKQLFTNFFYDISKVIPINEQLAASFNLIEEETNLNLMWTDRASYKSVTLKLLHLEIADKKESVFYKLCNVYTLPSIDLPLPSINSNKLQRNYSN